MTDTTKFKSGDQVRCAAGGTFGNAPGADTATVLGHVSGPGSSVFGATAITSHGNFYESALTLAVTTPRPEVDTSDAAVEALVTWQSEMAMKTDDCYGINSHSDMHYRTACSLAILRAERAALNAEVARLRGLMWYAWREMNAIRARSGVPLDFDGTPQGIEPGYWSNVVDLMDAELGEDAKPWPSKDARAALTPPDTVPAPRDDRPINPEDGGCGA